MSNNSPNSRKRKQFNIEPPRISQAEDQSFNRVLDRMLGRNSDALDIQNTGHPDIQTSSNPDAQASKLPLTQVSTFPAIQTPNVPDTQASEFPDIQTSTNPDAQVSELPVVQLPSRPARRRSSRPDAQASNPPTEMDSWKASLDTQTSSDEKSLAMGTLVEYNYRSRVERRAKNVRLPVQKLNKYEAWCFLNKVDFQDAVEQAMDALTGSPGVHMMTNDHDENREDDKLISSIAKFYQKWSGNRVNDKDYAAIREIAHQREAIIKCGVMLSLLRCPDGQKVRSFRYCHGAIEETASTPEPLAAPDEFLHYLMNKWAQRQRA